MADVLLGSRDSKLKETAPDTELVTFLDFCLSEIYDTKEGFRGTGYKAYKISLHMFDV